MDPACPWMRKDLFPGAVMAKDHSDGVLVPPGWPVTFPTGRGVRGRDALLRGDRVTRVEVSPGVTGLEPRGGQEGSGPGFLLIAQLRTAALFGPRCRCLFQNFFPKLLKYLGPRLWLGPVLN